MKKIFLLSLVLVTSLSIATIVSKVSLADPSNSPARQATSYCNTKAVPADRRNCRAAWLCGNHYWREKDKNHCKNSTNFNGVNIKKYVDKYPNGVLAKAIAEGKKVARAENVKKPSGSDSDGGGGSGSGDSTNADSSPGAGTSTTAEEEESKSGLADKDKMGADIVAGQVKLTGGDAKNAGIDNNTSEDIIGGILNVVYSVSAVIAVIVIVVAGIMYITSDGDAARVGKAKSAIIYSAVGLVIIGSAFIITGIIQNIGM